MSDMIIKLSEDSHIESSVIVGLRRHKTVNWYMLCVDISQDFNPCQAFKFKSVIARDREFVRIFKDWTASKAKLSSLPSCGTLLTAGA